MAETHGFIRIPPDSTGKRLANTVMLELAYSSATRSPRIGELLTITELSLTCKVFELHEDSASSGEVHAVILEPVPNNFTITTGLAIKDATGVTIASSVSGNSFYFQQTVITGGSQLTNHMEVDERGAASVRFSEGSPLSDAFGNLKVSNTTTIGSYDFIADSDDDLWSQETVGGGSITRMADASTMSLATGSASGDYAAMTTNHHHYYLPGTANTLMMTIALSDTGHAGCERRWGFLDTHNGIYFDIDDAGVIEVVVRSSVSGTLVKTHITQSNWNGDRLDGSDSSRFVLDLSKLNIYWIDYQWLGAGRVRFGVVDELGNRIVCHTMENANHNLYPYMSSGSLPVGIQCENKTVTGGAASIRLTCASVHTEGNLSYTYWRYAHSFPLKSISAPNTYLVALKSLNEFLGKHNVTTGYPESLGLYVTGGSIKLDIYWDFYTLGGTPNWVSNDSTIVADYSGTVDPTTGWSPKSWYLDAGSHNIDLTDIFDKNDFGLDINADLSEPVYVLLAASVLSGTPSVTGSLNYAELR